MNIRFQFKFTKFSDSFLLKSEDQRIPAGTVISRALLGSGGNTNYVSEMYLKCI